ncbi:MAG: M23 family metallopeptidase [Clostridia bacterium]|nr:M23 family metallopeptidase [Clostridia bacterium]
MEFHGNTYKDKAGNPTNGATTGCHLHLGIRIDEKYINPLELFNKKE